MIDRSSETERRPRPEAVRRSLRALVEGSALGSRRNPAEAAPRGPAASPPPESVVRDAEGAAEDARVAAAFLSADRLPELDAAIATAATRAGDEVAQRGRRARESLRRLDAAL